ncbi:MAG: DUF3256 family protein [Prevotella sp.]|jgi:hypothetical protein|nr:DUF3256 family protein [Prevotella sp.]
MKRLTFIILVLSCLSYSGHAQDISNIFLHVPSSVILGLDASQKDMLVANPESTSEVVVKRGSHGDVKRQAISSDFISLKTSDAGTIQIKLLPLINDSKIICVVKTACSKMCDSQIEFYTTKWIPISQTLFPAKNKNWFIKSDADRESQDFKNAYAALDVNPMVITLSPTGTTLSISYDIKNYLSEEDYKKIQPFLTEKPREFIWDKISYK